MDKEDNPVYDVMKSINVSMEEAIELLNKSGGSVPDAIVLFYNPDFKKEHIVQNSDNENISKISELRNILNNFHENKKNNVNELNN